MGWCLPCLPPAVCLRPRRSRGHAGVSRAPHAEAWRTLLIGGSASIPGCCPQGGAQGPHLQALQPPVPTGDSGCPHTFPGGPSSPPPAPTTQVCHMLSKTQKTTSAVEVEREARSRCRGSVGGGALGPHQPRAAAAEISPPAPHRRGVESSLRALVQASDTRGSSVSLHPSLY